MHTRTSVYTRKPDMTPDMPQRSSASLTGSTSGKHTLTAMTTRGSTATRCQGLVGAWQRCCSIMCSTISTKATEMRAHVATGYCWKATSDLRVHTAALAAPRANGTTSMMALRGVSPRPSSGLEATWRSTFATCPVTVASAPRNVAVYTSSTGVGVAPACTTGIVTGSPVGSCHSPGPNAKVARPMAMAMRRPSVGPLITGRIISPR
mmetsp:Transcript_10970/g.37215  ORF Transcript_10970/g.37215 Transcript_10970/m.37215 type:complete len:207 (+) Transcript_10970:113-733(+)